MIMIDNGARYLVSRFLGNNISTSPREYKPLDLISHSRLKKSAKSVKF